MDIFIILTLPMHEHELSFHLSVSFSISFLSILQFLVYRSFISLVKFIPKYFIVFDAIVYGIIFFISFSDSSLLVYRHATDFCTLILYPATLLKLFISCKSFLLESLGFPIYKIISSATGDHITSSFLI